MSATLASILEVVMVVSFGLSWPMNISKAWKARTAKGTSLSFLLLIEFGYACGVAAKLLSGKITYVIFFYALNFVMLAIALAVYVRNVALDKKAARDAARAAEKTGE